MPKVILKLLKCFSIIHKIVFSQGIWLYTSHCYFARSFFRNQNEIDCSDEIMVGRVSERTARLSVCHRRGRRRHREVIGGSLDGVVLLWQRMMKDILQPKQLGLILLVASDVFRFNEGERVIFHHLPKFPILRPE